MIILLILMLGHFGHGHTEKENKNELTEISVETAIDIDLKNFEVEDPADFSVSTTKTSDKVNNWELRKHDDGVFIYQRWMEAEPGRKARELYAEIQVNSTPRQLAQIIRSEKYGTEWLSMADEYKVLHENSDSEWYAYSRFNFLPALKFDLVTRNEMNLNSASHNITIDISGQPN